MGDTRLQLELVLLLVTHIEISISMVPNVGVTRKICYMSLRNKHRRTDRRLDRLKRVYGWLDSWIDGLQSSSLFSAFSFCTSLPFCECLFMFGPFPGNCWFLCDLIYSPHIGLWGAFLWPSFHSKNPKNPVNTNEGCRGFKQRLGHWVTWPEVI